MRANFSGVGSQFCMCDRQTQTDILLCLCPHAATSVFHPPSENPIRVDSLGIQKPKVSPA